MGNSAEKSIWCKSVARKVGEVCLEAAALDFRDTSADEGGVDPEPSWNRGLCLSLPSRIPAARAAAAIAFAFACRSRSSRRAIDLSEVVCGPGLLGI